MWYKLVKSLIQIEIDIKKSPDNLPTKRQYTKLLRNVKFIRNQCLEKPSH